MTKRYWLGFLVAFLATFSVRSAEAQRQVYGFDDGTFQGWQYVDANGDLYDNDVNGVGWEVSIDDIQIDTGPGGDPWFLLQGSTVDGPGTPGINNHPSSPTGAGRSLNYRVIPGPWGDRDNNERTHILKSPSFELNGAGPLSVDLIGGQASGGGPVTEFPQSPADLPLEAVADGAGSWQGFALYDVADDAYVSWGFSDINNDGEVPADTPGRSAWDTVELPEEDLAPRRNDGKEYQVHIFDSDLGGWGWIGFDTVVIPTTVGVPGDVNGDDVTNRDDFNVISQNFGLAPAARSEGDLVDPPDEVDLLDFRFWKSSDGATAEDPGLANIPEPATAALAGLCLAAAGVLLRRRTHGQ